MGRIGAPEIIVFLVVLLLLFGAKRLPDLSRSLGQSLRIFKSETKAMGKDDKPASGSEPTPPRQITATSDEVSDVSPVNEPDHTDR
jgi:sec-independent protein translocase protein TatA